ncbi:hypothetical protein GCM10020000_13820 [Streptomyces olivoverticillatus]
MSFVVAEVVSVATRVPERPGHGDLARSPRALGAYRTVRRAGDERLAPDSTVHVAPRAHRTAGPSGGLAPAAPRAPRGTGFVGFAPGPLVPVTPWVAGGPRRAGLGTSRTLRGAGPVVGPAPGSPVRTTSLSRGEAGVPDDPALMPGAHPVLAGPSVDVPRADWGNGGEAPGFGKGRGRGRVHPRHLGPRQRPGDRRHFRHHRHPPISGAPRSAGASANGTPRGSSRPSAVTSGAGRQAARSCRKVPSPQESGTGIRSSPTGATTRQSPRGGGPGGAPAAGEAGAGAGAGPVRRPRRHRPGLKGLNPFITPTTLTAPH